MDDTGPILIFITLSLVGGILLAANLSNRDNERKRAESCELLYTKYAKTSTDSLYFIDQGICQSPNEVKRLIKGS